MTKTMTTYLVARPAIIYEIEAENEDEAREYFWHEYDQNYTPETHDTLIVKEVKL